jgi:branched-chain amino acid transport system ATP-binding protein
MALLRTTGLSVSFGGVQALDRVDLTVVEGGIIGLIGPNGAGKTTLIDALTGMVPLSAGHIEFLGVGLGDVPPAARARMGLVRTFQTLELFEDLTVEHNLAVAAEPTPWWRFMADAVAPRRFARPTTRVDRALELVGLDAERHQLPAALSHGHRRLVGLARALATEPRLLLLDEPAAGLDSSETADLGARLRAMAAAGVTILLVDHDMGLVLDVCEEIHVLDFGRIIACGTPDQVREDPAVVAAYLGSTSEPS